jgi:hypothetical protein
MYDCSPEWRFIGTGWEHACLTRVLPQAGHFPAVRITQEDLIKENEAYKETLKWLFEGDTDTICHLREQAQYAKEAGLLDVNKLILKFLVEEFGEKVDNEEEV